MPLTQLAPPRLVRDIEATVDRESTSRASSSAHEVDGQEGGNNHRSVTPSARLLEKHRRALRVASLFSGIGGLELGLGSAGHKAEILCEIMEDARAVLRERFPAVDLRSDVRTLATLPKSIELLTAGFPCQDLSQAGRTRGIKGENSGLVEHIFRLIRHRRVPWVLLENVPFMMQLRKGEALEHVVSRFEELGYNWAYRIVDSRAFGLPQRRQRWYLLASLDGDPRDVLLSEDAGEPHAPVCEDWAGRIACGFYWTEGNRGLGWAYNAIPTLKGGSGLGIPSPPAVVGLDRRIIKPEIRDAERLQGFEEDWTKPAELVGRASMRWKLVGNAVTVDVARWIGQKLRAPERYSDINDSQMETGRPWPKAAWNMGRGRFASSVSTFPVHGKAEDLAGFLCYSADSYLSVKATQGFLGRLEKSTLHPPEPFKEILRDHIKWMESREGGKRRKSS